MFDLYTEIILDHYKNPHNKGELKNPTTHATETNSSCGDKLTFYIKTDSKGMIKKATWQGEGCAISQASASLLSDELIGKSIDEIKKLPNEFIYKLLKVQISPGRSKCALLSLATIKKAIS